MRHGRRKRRRRKKRLLIKVKEMSREKGFLVKLKQLINCSTRERKRGR